MSLSMKEKRERSYFSLVPTSKNFPHSILHPRIVMS